MSVGKAGGSVGSAEETLGGNPIQTTSDSVGKESTDAMEVVSVYDELSMASEDRAGDSPIAVDRSNEDLDFDGDSRASVSIPRLVLPGSGGSRASSIGGAEDDRASSASLEFAKASEELGNTSIDDRASMEVNKASDDKESIDEAVRIRASDAFLAALRDIEDLGAAVEGMATSAASTGSNKTTSVVCIRSASGGTISIPRLVIPGSGDSQASSKDIGVAVEGRAKSAGSFSSSSGTMSVGSGCIRNASGRNLSIPRLVLPGSGDSCASVSIPRLIIPGSGDSRASVSIPRLVLPGSGGSRASSKSDKSGSDDSYGNFFQLALSEMDARDKAAGWNAGALTIPRPDNISLGNKLGDGGFGTVWEATDARSGQMVAVKELNGAFWTANQAQRAYQEVYYMWQLGCHKNILGLLGIYETASSSVWLVCERMETDLHTVIHRNILDPDEKRHIGYQICSAAQFLHSGNVIHRDFKPENVLWNRDNTVKICDFGMVRSLSEVGRENTSTDPQLMTAGMGTLWHAAPEVLMESNSYTTAVDVWAIGSTFVELLTGIIMAEGLDKFQQLQMIFVRLPVPTLQDIQSLKSPFTTRAFDAANAMAGIDRTEYGLEKLMSGCTADAIDLCKRMLTVNPDMRCTMEEALNHPYLACYWDPANDIVMTDELVPPLSDWKVHSVDEYRAKAAEIMKDIQG